MRTTFARGWFLLCLVLLPCWSGSRTGARAAAPDYQVFPDTRSPDGRYAVAWDGDEASDPETHPNRNYLVDLSRRQVVVLLAGIDYFPHQNHASLEVAWSPDSRRALVISGGRFSPDEIVLLWGAPGRALDRQTRLLSPLDEAYRRYLNRARHEDYQRVRHRVVVDFRSPRLTGTDRLELDASMVVPKGEEDLGEDRIVVRLPALSPDGRPPRAVELLSARTIDPSGAAVPTGPVPPPGAPPDDPSAAPSSGQEAPPGSDPGDHPAAEPPGGDAAAAAAAADRRLNAVYRQLVGRLEPGAGAALRAEQRAWLQRRDAAVAAAGRGASTPAAARQRQLGRLAQVTAARADELDARRRQLP